MQGWFVSKFSVDKTLKRWAWLTWPCFSRASQLLRSSLSPSQICYGYDISEMLLKHSWEMTAFLNFNIIPRGQLTNFAKQAGRISQFWHVYILSNHTSKKSYLTSVESLEWKNILLSRPELDKLASSQEGRGGKRRDSAAVCPTDRTEQAVVVFLRLLKNVLMNLQSMGSSCASAAHWSGSLTHCPGYMVSVRWDFNILLLCKHVVRCNSEELLKGHFRVHSLIGLDSVSRTRFFWPVVYLSYVWMYFSMKQPKPLSKSCDLPQCE